jgi:hypothetical protein
MAFVGRLILRIIVVPLGAGLAILAATVVSFVANWSALVATIQPGSRDDFFPIDVAAAFMMAAVLSATTVKMLMPTVIGILVSEVFVIRSWIFHALNGAVSIWVGWWGSVAPRPQLDFYASPLSILGLGVLAGFVYWAIAGWNAGLFRPTPPPSATPR